MTAKGTQFGVMGTVGISEEEGGGGVMKRGGRYGEEGMKRRRGIWGGRYEEGMVVRKGIDSVENMWMYIVNKAIENSISLVLSIKV